MGEVASYNSYTWKKTERKEKGWRNKRELTATAWVVGLSVPLGRHLQQGARNVEDGLRHRLDATRNDAAALGRVWKHIGLDVDVGLCCLLGHVPKNQARRTDRMSG